MNFTDFAFWWALGLLGLVSWTVIGLARLLGLWREAYDKAALLVVSLALFFNASPISFVILVCELAFNFAMVRVIARADSHFARLGTVAAIIVNLSVLAYFKYLDFFTAAVGGALPLATLAQYSTISRATIPPGISFYTFQKVGFAVDTLRQRPEPPPRAIDYLNFGSFFPLLVAGPIERKRDLLPQMQAFRFRFTAADVERGLRLMTLGLFLKLVLADNLTTFIPLGETHNAVTIWASMLVFGLRIYFDFSGYSLIALGMARVMGVRLTFNFAAPYTARSIQDFWRRWHITLSNWFRDYVYLPLGGSRVPWVAVNILLVFGLSGLWHGAGWNYIAWGLYHGALLVLQRQFAGTSWRLPAAVSWMLTFTLVMFGWLFFMETDSARLVAKLQTLVTPAAYSAAGFTQWLSSMGGPEVALLMTVLAMSAAMLIAEARAVHRQEPNAYESMLTPLVSRVLLASLFFLCARSSSDFVYFAF